MGERAAGDGGQGFGEGFGGIEPEAEGDGAEEQANQGDGPSDDEPFADGLEAVGLAFDAGFGLQKKVHGEAEQEQRPAGGVSHGVTSCVSYQLSAVSFQLFDF